MKEGLGIHDDVVQPGYSFILGGCKRIRLLVVGMLWRWDRIVHYRRRNPPKHGTQKGYLLVNIPLPGWLFLTPLFLQWQLAVTPSVCMSTGGNTNHH
jgi:hypothetical protein